MKFMPIRSCDLQIKEIFFIYGIFHRLLNLYNLTIYNLDKFTLSGSASVNASAMRVHIGWIAGTRYLMCFV